MTSLRVIIVTFIAFTIITLYGCSINEVDFIVDLGLLKGHLIVGEELLNRGNPLMAEHHFIDPIEELLEIPSNNRRLDFKDDLKTLAQDVETTPSTSKIEENIKNISRKIDKLIAKKQKSQELRVISKIMKQAEEKYKGAVKIVNDNTKKVITYADYQDVRGFTKSAKELFEIMSKRRQQKYSNVGGLLEEIIEILPLNPPESIDNYYKVTSKINELIKACNSKSN